jgi:hypothetical protein
MQRIALVRTRVLLCSFVGALGVSGCGGSAPAQGSVSLTWSIFDGLNGQPATCATVGAASVSLQATSQAASGGSVTLSVPCARSSSGTIELAVGTYRIVPQLVTADGAVLATASDQTAAVTAGQTTALTPALFAASTRSGFFALSLSTGSTNCQPGGAGITGVSMFLEHAGDGCAPTTLIRSRGGVQLGTYDINNCSSPSVTSCIEADELLTAGNLTPGSYILRVRAKRGPLDCWKLDETFTLVPGRPLVRTLTLAHAPDAGC